MQFIDYHFKASQREISKSSSIKHFVLSFKVFDCDVIVQDDGLGLLDVTQGGHIKHHAAHVVGVTPNLQQEYRALQTTLSFTWNLQT